MSEKFQLNDSKTFYWYCLKNFTWYLSKNSQSFFKILNLQISIFFFLEFLRFSKTVMQFFHNLSKITSKFCIISLKFVKITKGRGKEEKWC